MRIDVYSDISCPWCYLAMRNMHAALEGRDDVEVVAHPYQIDGERPEPPVPMLEFLGRKYGHERAAKMNEAVTTAGAELGVTFHNDRGFSANTLQAHRLLWMVGREHGWRTRAVLEELLFAQWFTHGGNVADPDLLIRCAVQAGVPGAEPFVRSDEGTAEVRALIAKSRAEVAAVPVVVVDGATRLENYQSVAAYRAALGAKETL